MTAKFSAADYTGALSALRPRGRVWPQDPSSVQMQILAAFAPSFVRLDAGAQGLLVDAFPSTTVSLLADWQASLGLPDPCAGPSATLAQSQAQVVSRFTAVGGQSRQAFIDYAAGLGFSITIQTFNTFRCGLGGCGDPLGGPDWTLAWQVTVSASANGFSNAVLLCELNAIKPVDTTVFLAS